MKIFLTGATGHIGSSVLESFIRSGHKVTSLVRDRAKAELVSARGADAVVGDIGKAASYAAVARDADVIVHTAIDKSVLHGQALDRLAIDTFLAVAGSRVAAGLTAALVYTSGVWVLGNTSAPAAEDSPVSPTPFFAWRPDHEQLVFEGCRAAGIRAAVIRPGIVYGGGRGIIADLLKDAANGLLRIIGEGKNHWPCVYSRDLADLYMRVATNAEAAGVFHANDEADESVADIVDAIANHAAMRPDIRHVPLGEARAKMGSYADALALDQLVRSPRARALGWSPTLHSVAGNVARLREEFRTRREAA